jgi:uncharacterized membrane protein YcjF (UPF0283 family)
MARDLAQLAFRYWWRKTRMIERVMDRYRGRPGVLGRWVLRQDVAWIQAIARIATQRNRSDRT